jgi:hypothetical protein
LNVGDETSPAAAPPLLFGCCGLRNFSFRSKRQAKPWFRKKRYRVEFLKLQKDYSFSNTMIFKTIKFVALKHFMAI